MSFHTKKAFGNRRPCIHDGGDEGDRTPDLLTASQALSQLSYAPVRKRYYRGSLSLMQGLFWVDLLTYGIFGTGPKISPWPSASAQFYGQSRKSLLIEVSDDGAGVDLDLGRSPNDIRDAGVG